MAGVIRNYNLSISEGKEDYIKGPFKLFEPFSDGLIENYDDLFCMIETARFLIGQGKFPIMTIFVDSGKCLKGG